MKCNIKLKSKISVQAQSNAKSLSGCAWQPLVPIPRTLKNQIQWGEPRNLRNWGWFKKYPALRGSHNLFSSPTLPMALLYVAKLNDDFCFFCSSGSCKGHHSRSLLYCSEQWCSKFLLWRPRPTAIVVSTHASKRNTPGESGERLLFGDCNKLHLKNLPGSFLSFPVHKLSFLLRGPVSYFGNACFSSALGWCRWLLVNTMLRPYEPNLIRSEFSRVIWWVCSLAGWYDATKKTHSCLTRCWHLLVGHPKIQQNIKQRLSLPVLRFAISAASRQAYRSSLFALPQSSPWMVKTWSRWSLRLSPRIVGASSWSSPHPRSSQKGGTLQLPFS